jgi:enamine deaminase RidA (YjgF/YER057c/UK114 family)
VSRVGGPCHHVAVTSIERIRPEGLVRSPAFSHVAVVPPGATTIYLGGQNAVDVDGSVVGEGDAAAQSARALANAKTALAAAGATVRDVVQWTVLFVDGVDIAAGYQAIASEFASDEPALVTAARVAGLGVPGALVEIGAIAAVVR